MNCSKLLWLVDDVSEQNLIMMRIFIHVSVAIILGTLYWQKGENASEVFNNAGLLFFLEFFILYTAMMPTVLTCQYRRAVFFCQERSSLSYLRCSIYLKQFRWRDKSWFENT